MTAAEISSENGSQKSPLVAFVHIPRTGGRSVRSAIGRAYSRPQSAGDIKSGADKSANILQRVAGEPGAWNGRVLTGFIPYGLYARHLPADTRYITFMRDPVERVVSQFFQDTAGKEERPTLKSALESGAPVYNNLATRFLSGEESLEGDLPADALDRAKQNLASFTFVGLTERMDEAIVLLGDVLGAAPRGYVRRPQTTERPPVSEVPSAVRSLIETHNALDLELYRLARERFEAELSAAGDVGAKVEELKLQQAAALQESEAERSARKANRRQGKRGGRGLNADELTATLAALEQRLQAIEAAVGTAPAGRGKKAKAERPAGAKKAARADRPKKAAGAGRKKTGAGTAPADDAGDAPDA